MKAILCSVLFVMASVSLAVAQGTYTQIDVPGAIHTYCYGINATGDISGSYSDDIGWHGFLLSGGTFSTLDFPGAVDTYVYGLNDRSQVVGYAYNGIWSTGFAYDPRNQAFRKINFPGASTVPTSIDNRGDIVGWFNNSSGFPQGFERASSSYSLVVPGGDVGAYVRGISSQTNEIVGLGLLADFSGTNFSDNLGNFQQISIPGFPAAQVYGVDSTGLVLVGVLNPTPFTYAGFVYENNAVQQLLPSASAQQTIASGVNGSGQVVGLFIDANGIEHGFLWTPPSDLVSK